MVLDLQENLSQKFHSFLLLKPNLYFSKQKPDFFFFFIKIFYVQNQICIFHKKKLHFHKKSVFSYIYKNKTRSEFLLIKLILSHHGNLNLNF